jgi:hypothetical protein
MFCGFALKGQNREGKDKAEKCGAEKSNSPRASASIFLPDIFLLYPVFTFPVAGKSFDPAPATSGLSVTFIEITKTPE